MASTKDDSGMDGTMADQRTTNQRILLLFGSVGPLGYAPASGTVTVAVVGIPLYLLMQHYLSLAAYIVVTIVFTGVSVLVHDAGDRILGEKDSRKLVLDELVGFFVAMTAVPATWQLIVLGFFLERGIDIAKIFPANLVERRLPGGWGVVGDDVVAGLYTLGLLHLACHFLPAAVGLAAG
jgi:phosphatidylglycerophosphatase A